MKIEMGSSTKQPQNAAFKVHKENQVLNLKENLRVHQQAGIQYPCYYCHATTRSALNPYMNTCEQQAIIRRSLNRHKEAIHDGASYQM